MEAEQQVTRSVEIPADAGAVWERVSDERQLSAWLGGQVELDVRPGGEGLLRQPDGGARRMVVEEVRPGERLAFHWWPAEREGRTPADAGATTVDIRLVPLEHGTRVTVTETATVALAGVAPAAGARGVLLVAGGVPVRA